MSIHVPYMKSLTSTMRARALCTHNNNSDNDGDYDNADSSQLHRLNWPIRQISQLGKSIIGYIIDILILINLRCQTGLNCMLVKEISYISPR